MTKNKRYQLRQEQLDYPIVNFCSDLIDTANNDKVICSFELDVGTSKMVDLLNEQEEVIQEYKHLVKIATSLIEWNTIPQVRREWKKHLSKVGDVE